MAPGEDNIQIPPDDEAQIEAAWDALTTDPPTLDGWIYRDGEVWCDRQSLEEWRMRNAGAPAVTLEEL